MTTRHKPLEWAEDPKVDGFWKADSVFGWIQIIREKGRYGHSEDYYVSTTIGYVPSSTGEPFHTFGGAKSAAQLHVDNAIEKYAQ